MRGAESACLVAALVLASGPSTGCSSISYGEVSTSQRLLDARDEIVPSGRLGGYVEQNEEQVVVRAFERCDLVSIGRVERTIVEEKELGEPALDYAILGVALVPLSIGTLMLVDAGNVYDDDPNQRLYNATGPEATVAAGTVLVVLGLAIAAGPVVDFVRAAGSDERKEIAFERGAVRQRDVRCRGNGPAADRELTARLGGAELWLGLTDARGEARIELSRVLADYGTQAPTPREMEILVEGTHLGTVELSGVVQRVERERRQAAELAWDALDVRACTLDLDPGACDALRDFVATHPQSPHAAEARELLEGLEPTLRAHAAGAESVAAHRAATAIEAARAASRAARDEACEEACARGCREDRSCVLACTREACGDAP